VAHALQAPGVEDVHQPSSEVFMFGTQATELKGKNSYSSQ